MAWYVYWQRTPESPWELAQAENIEQIVEDNEPPFTTVLELDTVVADSFSNEDYSKIKYRGAFYADFDGETLEEVIPQFKAYLQKLVEHGVNLTDCQLSVTGGRGFHVLVPQKVFDQGQPQAGTKALPLIYREMAYKLFVDTLDLRVYSTKKGRMWRTFGVKRPNGNYKVQISAAEAMDMTVELYKEIAADGSRACWDAPEPFTYAPLLASVFAEAKSQVEKAMEKRAKAKNENLSRFEGKAPGSLLALMRGETAREGVGFQQLSTQLAIAAHELKWSEDEFIQNCSGLCENHDSDGSRYNTPEKRRRELRRMYQYMDGNPCYTFSVSAVAAVLEKGVNYKDLRPPVGPPPENDDELEEDELDALCEGFIVRQSAIWQKVHDKQADEWVAKLVADVGISNVVELMPLGEDRPEGFEVTVHPSGGTPFRTRIMNNDFETRVSLRRALGSPGHLKVTDAQVGGLQTVLSRMAQKGGQQMLSITTEGVNVLRRPPEQPDPTGKSDYYIWWLTKREPFYYPLKGEVQTQDYRLDPLVESNRGQGRSDLDLAERMDGSDANRELLETLFNAYPKDVMAKALGWYVSSFFCPLFRHHFNQFPVLQCYGTAGGGKTSLNYILAFMHTHQLSPAVISTPHVTDFAMAAPLASSSSVPVLFDEVKFREMTTSRGNTFKALMRNNYNGNSGSKGGVSRGSGTSRLVVNETLNVAPMAVMTEARIDQEAILHRSVLVDFPHAHTTSESSLRFMWLKSQARRLGGLGRLILDRVMRTHVEGFAPAFEAIRAEMIGKAPGVADRPLYNLAVVVTGLRTLKGTLSNLFEGYFDTMMDELIAIVADEPAKHVANVQSEIARVLANLSTLASRDPDDKLALLRGADYEIRGECVQLHVSNCWDKYARLCRDQGVERLFDTESAFADSLFRHPAVTDRICSGSTLKKGRFMTLVVALDQDVLSAEGVSSFTKETD